MDREGCGGVNAKVVITDEGLVVGIKQGYSAGGTGGCTARAGYDRNVDVWYTAGRGTDGYFVND
ncbi:MAG: hypothetical protein AAB896_01405 [Patescibacteria group bacterium]